MMPRSAHWQDQRNNHQKIGSQIGWPATGRTRGTDHQKLLPRLVGWLLVEQEQQTIKNMLASHWQGRKNRPLEINALIRETTADRAREHTTKKWCLDWLASRVRD